MEDGQDMPEDYEGRHIDYSKRVVEVLNDFIRARILAGGRKLILTYWAITSPAERAIMGEAVEKLFLGDLCTDGDIELKRKILDGNKTDGDWLNLTGTREVLANAADEAEATNQLKLVLGNASQVTRLFSGYTAIDAAGPGKRVYQVTISPDHEKNKDGILNLLTFAGFLDKQSNGEYVALYNDTVEVSKLEFYWTVPPSIFEHWGNKRPTYYKANKEKSTNTLTILKECWDKCVVQYALEIPYEDPHVKKT
jgi:hypothetical protein